MRTAAALAALLVVALATVAFADDRGVPLRVETITDPDIAALYEEPLVLVRPDGHVAWRGKSVADARWIIDVVRGEQRAAQSLSA